MKVSILFLSVVVCMNANAKLQRVDFDRNTASSKSANLNTAFQNAMSDSDSDLHSTKTSVLVEEKERLASWNQRKREKIVVEGTAAIDQSDIKASPKKYTGESQIETEKQLKNDLKVLRRKGV